jgi:hypothetical protein
MKGPFTVKGVMNQTSVVNGLVPDYELLPAVLPTRVQKNTIRFDEVAACLSYLGTRMLCTIRANGYNSCYKENYVDSNDNRLLSVATTTT